MQWGNEASSAVKKPNSQHQKIRTEKQLTRHKAYVSCFSVCGYWLKLTRERMPASTAA